MEEIIKHIDMEMLNRIAIKEATLTNTCFYRQARKYIPGK